MSWGRTCSYDGCGKLISGNSVTGLCPLHHNWAIAAKRYQRDGGHKTVDVTADLSAEVRRLRSAFKTVSQICAATGLNRYQVDTILGLR